MVNITQYEMCSGFSAAEVPILNLGVTPAKDFSRHNIALEEKWAKFCIETTSYDKRENVLIIKQLRWFYYIVKERDKCLQVELDTLLSIQNLIMTVKCQRKDEVGRLSRPCKINQLRGWRGWAKGPHRRANPPQNELIIQALGRDEAPV